MNDNNMKFQKITEYIFAPFNTFVFLDVDEIRFKYDSFLKNRIIEEIGKIPININGKQYKIQWEAKTTEKLHRAKGVFTPVSKEGSYLLGWLISDKTEDCFMPIEEEVAGIFPENSLKFTNVKFYIDTAGVGCCSVDVEIEKREGIKILQLEKISEKLNKLYKKYFEEICYKISLKYAQTIKKLNIPNFTFDFFPEPSTFSDDEKSEHILPWTHRIYHINDDHLFELENPGDPFKFLVTPAKKMDVNDFSIYDNRYIYFGWGHSIILTSNKKSKFSQTTYKVYDDYVRLIEIAQTHWRSLEILINLVDYAVVWFNFHFKEMKLKRIKRAIYNIREFNRSINRVLDTFSGIKITFDTEKRNLLQELNDRWHTSEIFEKLQEKLNMIENFLQDLFQRQKEKVDDSINAIVLLFTIISLVDIFGTIFDILTLDLALSAILQLIVLITGTIGLGLIIIFYLKMSEKR